MAKNRTEIKNLVNALSPKYLADIVLKLSAKKEIYDFLLVNYFDKQSGEKDLFDEAKADIERLSWKRYKGFSEQLQLANMLSACIKRVNEFTKISKNKKLEADLVLYVLQIPFAYSPKMLGTCFTAYDYKIGLLLKRLITLVTKKLHEDYKIEYTDIINKYLEILHRTSDHIDTVYNLPQSI